MSRVPYTVQRVAVLSIARFDVSGDTWRFIIGPSACREAVLLTTGGGAVAMSSNREGVTLRIDAVGRLEDSRPPWQVLMDHVSLTSPELARAMRKAEADGFKFISVTR